MIDAPHWIGEKVVFNGKVYTIIGIDGAPMGQVAWLRRHGKYNIADISQLERIN